MIYPQNFEQKIGFDQIRQLLKDKCLSTLGEEKVSDMGFSEQYEVVEENLNQVTEFVRIIQEEDGFPTNFFRCPPFTETGTDRRNVSGRTGIIRLAPFTRDHS